MSGLVQGGDLFENGFENGAIFDVTIEFGDFFEVELFLAQRNVKN